MFRTALRLTSVLMLATLILDVTNSKTSSKKAIAPKSGQLETKEPGYYKKVCNKIEQWKKKVRSTPRYLPGTKVSSWSGKGLMGYFPKFWKQANPLLRNALRFTLLVIKNTCLFVQGVKYRLNNPPR